MDSTNRINHNLVILELKKKKKKSVHFTNICA